MSKSDLHENAILLLEFNNTNEADIGDATGLRGSTAAGNFYLSLHTASPGEAGNQGTNEVAYTSYARVAIPRSGSGFTVVTNSVVNATLVQFPQCTGGSATATHFGLGTASSGTGKLLRYGALGASLAISNLVQPQFPIGTLSFTED